MCNSSAHTMYFLHKKMKKDLLKQRKGVSGMPAMLDINNDICQQWQTTCVPEKGSFNLTQRLNFLAICAWAQIWEHKDIADLTLYIVYHLCTYVQKCRLMRFNALCEQSSQVPFTYYFNHIWQNYVCFGDFLGKTTLCNAYHKEHASH